MRLVRDTLMRIAITVGIGILRLIYCFLKQLAIDDNKVVFCSRQSSQIPLDFALIQRALDAKLGADTSSDSHALRYINLCARVERTPSSIIKFVAYSLASMYHLATARVCVIDSYWPIVCILNHRPELTVIQIWHAIGKLKRSGHASVGKLSGRTSTIATLMHMHENYDYIIAGAEHWNPYYCEAFNVTEDRLLGYGLPRIDYLLETAESNRERFFAENPHLVGKKIILYAPTFRRNMENRWAEVIGVINSDKYELIIKLHPNISAACEDDIKDRFFYENYKTMDLLAVCDYVITDYSAITLEAAVLGRKAYHWIYDYDEYMENNGLNLDLKRECPDHSFESLDDLMRAIDADIYTDEQMAEFQEKYLPRDLGTSTDKITDLIITSLRRR